MGHIMDLPKKDLGVDIDHGFKPTYITIPAQEECDRRSEIRGDQGRRRLPRR